MNKQKGNMYPFVSHTWNVTKGKCPHDCSYCYMKVYKQPELHFDALELKSNFGKGNSIFVGSSCDAWAKPIPDVWIKSMLLQCCEYPENKYLFQSKNPARFKEFSGQFPPQFMLGTTIESNRCCCDFSPNAPCTSERYLAMKQIQFPKMVNVEPIMDFDLEEFADWIRDINPEFVSIGADSKGHHLPEPTPDKVEALITNLQPFTKVIIKDNLKRMMFSHFGINRKEFPAPMGRCR